MRIEFLEDVHGRSARLAGELTIAHLSDLRGALDSSCVQGLRLDLSDVERIDSAGLQLLLALAPRCGTVAWIGACSPPVQALIELYHVAASLACAPQTGETQCQS
jgi:ABC-type transporter Mla MlaB component